MPEEKTITATEAVRKFSELLNFVKYKGENYQIFRGGKPVALLHPVGAAPKASPVQTIPEVLPDEEIRSRSLGHLKKLLKTFPKLEGEAENFEREVIKVLQFQPSLPKKSPWE